MKSFINYVKVTMNNNFLKPLWHYTDPDPYNRITSMHLELTNKCNAGCPMCPRYENYGAKLNENLVLDEITIDKFKNWFLPDFVKGLKKVYSCGNYGDPIVAADTLLIYKYLRETNPNLTLQIFTNASARTTSWWAELGTIINSGLKGRGDHVTFSVDGLADTNHLYRRNTFFEKIKENMEAFINAGGIAHWDFIVFKHNEHQVEEAKQLAKEMGFENFNVKKTTRWTKDRYFEVWGPNNQPLYKLEAPENPLYNDTTLQELKKKIKTEEQPANFLKNINYNANLKALFEMKADEYSKYITYRSEKVLANTIELEPRCIHFSRKGRIDNNEIFVTANGYVYPCCFLGGENDKPGEPELKDSVLKMIDLQGGLDSINLNVNSLESVVSSSLYKDWLVDSFELGNVMRSVQCTECCGKEWDKLSYGEMGDRGSGYFNEDSQKIINDKFGKK